MITNDPADERREFGCPLILASQSPRRQLLLREAGYPFSVIPPDPLAECPILAPESPAQMVSRLAFQKGANVACKVSSGLVLACDTLAECSGVILGKPENRNHAREMLLLLRGRSHSVYTGMCLWHVESERRMVRVDVSRLVMHAIDDQELEDYLESQLWVGKAGAFGFQDGPAWLELWEGTASNVVGLSLELLQSMLRDFGDLPASAQTATNASS